MSRRYDRSSRYGGTRWRWLVGVAVVALIATTVVPAASYTSADIDRSVTADVVADPNGVVGQAAESPRIGKTDTLTVLTNRFDTPIDVTIQLEWWNVVIAAIDDDNTPLERTFTLSPGESVDVPICVYRWVSNGTTIYYEFEFTGQGVAGSTTELRTATAHRPGNGGGNDDNPGNGNDNPGNGNDNPGNGNGNPRNGWCNL